MKPCIFILMSLPALWLCGCFSAGDDLYKNAENIDRAPHIRPDYTGLIIPPNIAPLNFIVDERGSGYAAKISGTAGRPVIVKSSRAELTIPQRQWKKLLAGASGGEIVYEVYVKRNGWKRFRSFSNWVAEEPVDHYLVYRSMPVIYNHYRDIRILQHDLTRGSGSTFFAFPPYRPGCVNCHTFCAIRPDLFSLQFRHNEFGNATLIVSPSKGRVAQVLNTKFGYGSWHPGGIMATYSINSVRQSFHTGTQEIRDHFDLNSHIVNYYAKEQTVRTVPWSADSSAMETWPCWSADGKVLYYCSSPRRWNSESAFPPPELEQVRYSLMQAPYEAATDTWGVPDTVLSSDRTGMSITMPRCSPDGNFLLFCMQDRGASPHLRQSSDLYLMDLRTKGYSKLGINSEFAESWHTWSRNSRWIAFSSKRQGGVLTRIYIAYIDRSGIAGRQFILPMADPHYYDAAINVCNTPEFVTGPVRVMKQTILNTVSSKKRTRIPPADISRPAAGSSAIQNTPQNAGSFNE